jgi:hypothetical protein
MFDDPTITPQDIRDQDPGPTKWICCTCRSPYRGAPRQRSVDARDRWRRDWCRTCGHVTFMEQLDPRGP